MNEQEQSKGETGEFFAMNLYQIDGMVKQGAGAEEVMAYTVLARGVNARKSDNTSSHGANSIATRTGMTHYRAEQALDWLASHNYILKLSALAKPVQTAQAAPSQEPLGKRTLEEYKAIIEANRKRQEHQVQEQKAQAIGQKASKKRLSKWLLLPALDAKDLYLANALTDGIGRGKNNPPLERIYIEAKYAAGHLITDTRLDCLMVLLHLYRYHDMAGCGGIDPRAGIYREWIPAENSEGNQVTPLDGTNCALYEIKGSSEAVFNKFASEALFYIDDANERHERFWAAFANLRRLGFLYEVTQIWSHNPNGDKKAKAEPLYTLYVQDSHARETDPYLQREIHTAAFKLDALDGYTEFSPLGLAKVGIDVGGDSNILRTQQFRYIATKKDAGYPLGIYRLRFRPKTNDTGKGISAERRRVGAWMEALRRVAP
jgi:hypothetical protein